MFLKQLKHMRYHAKCVLSFLNSILILEELRESEHIANA